MGLTSLQVCMDSSDWLQGTIHEESGLDSSSPSGGDMLTCSRPMIERRLRPPHDQALKCPRCDSTHTKFCYYNNYSLSQPRYFCKTCRRYWTKGGTLRNIPVGGGCRKNKKVVSNKKSSSSNDHYNNQIISSSNQTDLHLSFPEMQQFSSSHLVGNMYHGNPSSFMESDHNNQSRPIDFMDSKLEALVGSSRNLSYDFMGNNNNVHDQLSMISHGGGLGLGGGANVHGFCSNVPFGMSSLDHHVNNGGGGGTFMDTCQRLMLPYDHTNEDHNNVLDVKPNTKLLSLDWQDQGCSSDAAGINVKDSFGYLSNLGSWTGMMNGYGCGSSAANSLV